MDILERQLGPEDLEGCLALSAEAGWNQTGIDWRMLFEIGEARGLFRDGRLVASAGIVAYGGRIGWICMVLVTPAAQWQGLGTRLLLWAIERCAARGLIAGLDATPAGRHVYVKLGFQDVYGVKRLQRAVRPGRGEAAPASFVQPLDRVRLADIPAYDLPRFGADRSVLLSRWYDRRPDLAHLAMSAGTVSGYCVARDGLNAAHVGPVVAEDDATAIALLEAALSRLEGPVYIDVPDRHGRVLDRLLETGFTIQRPFTRMLMGRTEPLDRPAAIYALAGPEFA